MPVSRPGLRHRHKLRDCPHQCVHGRKRMIPGHGVVQGFPEALIPVHPGMPGGLEQQAHPWMVGQPLLYGVTFMDDVVVRDE